MFHPDKRLQRWADKYDKLYFDSSLGDVTVGWDDELPAKTEGLTIGIQEVDETKLTFFRVGINPSMKEGTTNALLLTLLHELAHVKLYPYMKHGKRFQDEMLRLASRGAMKGLW